jgi:phosphoribosyl-ATP pyrophosphohydrolase
MTGGLAEERREKAMKTFDELYAELSEKWREQTPGSGSVAALNAGIHHIGKKLVEEAAESWMAAEHEGPERLAEELSQLLYWSQLAMISAGLSPEDVYSRL